VENLSGNISPVPWTGNKGCIYHTINAFMPPHKVYIEPCCGSAEVFFRKIPAQKEILNDYNKDIVRFFRVLQNNKNLHRLIGRLYFSVNSEALFKANKELLKNSPDITSNVTETAMMIEGATDDEIELAVAFFENQIYSFSSTGTSFGIAAKDMTKRFGRLLAASIRLRNATILNKDYKDAINYAAGPNTFIFLDPPYRGTENYYQNSNFDTTEHDKLFEFMHGIDEKYNGKCKFLITYNNDPYIKALADKYGFDTYIQKRLHNMLQGAKPGEMFEELLIGNYDLLGQATQNEILLLDQTRQLSLFDYQYDY
jgi:DNA adenine methylase